jgi:hypothetical protein
MGKQMKKLTTMIILSFIGINAFAFCPSGPNYWACYEQEMQQIRMNQQLQQINNNLEAQRQQNNGFQPIRPHCFVDNWGNKQCF